MLYDFAPIVLIIQYNIDNDRRNVVLITDEEFQRISVYMKSNYGIDMSQKKVIINGRLENYLRKGGWNNCTEYLDALKSDKTGTLEKMLVNLLTTNHTYFMREFEHFDFFKGEVLPWLKTKESRNKDLRIWCGAASTGEEPYMIAMVLADFFGMEKKQWDTKVLATDISTKALQQAMIGVYSAEQLKNIPEPWKRHFFKAVAGGSQYKVTEELKAEVLFRQFNLMDRFPFKRKMHTVFLRNVMIYFEDETKYNLLNKIYDFMEPGGYLFIGTTENLDKNKTRFEYVRPSIYRK